MTSVSRTLLDLAEVVDLRRLARALERAEKLELFDLRALEATISRARGRRGLKNLSQALSLYLPDDRTRSGWERDFIDFCRDQGLPAPEVNAIVETAYEEFEVDALWAQSRLILELDSWEHHRTRAAFEQDRLRDAELGLAGYRVIRVTWRRLRDHPADVAMLLTRLLARRSAR